MSRSVLCLGLVMLSCAKGGASDTGAGEELVGTTDCFQVSTLLDVASAPGAGEDYPDPELQGVCDEDADEFAVASNGIPHYTYVSMTPNALVEAEHTWHVPLAPVINPDPTDIPLLGNAGFTVTGLPFYGPNEADFPDPFGDPIYNQITDGCKGHTAMAYHNHALEQVCLSTDGLVAEPWTLPEPDGSEASPILGWALDGHPVFGPYGCIDLDCSEVVELESGWEQTGDPSTHAWENHEYVEKAGAQYLDQCNGRIQPDGSYGYHATATFPYILGCYVGTAEDAGDDAPPGGGGPGGHH